MYIRRVHFAGELQMSQPGRSYSGRSVYRTPCSQRGFIIDAVTSALALVTCKRCKAAIERNRQDGFSPDYY